MKHGKLFTKLINLTFHSLCYNCWWCGISACICQTGHSHVWYNVPPGIGVRQGAILSPVFFLYVDRTLVI